jgi:hypothetical protein
MQVDDALKKHEQLKPLLDNLDTAMAGLDIYPPDKNFANEVSISNLRRSRRREVDDKVGMITLTNVDGVLQWEEGTGGLSMAGRRGRRGPIGGLAGEIVAQYKFEKLEPSQVIGFLETLDKKLTPTVGLRRWNGGALQPVDRPVGQQRLLLFIHGTFSNNDTFFAALNSTPDGQALLQRALNHYDEVLAFDHPTLAVSPVLNALDLARFFAGCPADVDLVCHSRGGLVARWWVECFGGGAPGRRRVVLVGSPLGGTSLAAPPRLRAALGLITNVGHTLSLVGDAVLTASVAVPLLSVAVGLVKVVTSITSLGAKTPLLDAAVAMIPGLAGQSRVGNNAELLRLRRRGDSPAPDYFAIRCNFEPTDPGWAFWKRFIGLKGQVAAAGADLVFEDQNDLVVDSASMTELYDGEVIPEKKVLDLGTTDRIYHTNYFQQPETINFIAKSLKIP